MLINCELHLQQIETLWKINKTESARNVSLQRKMDGNYEIFQHAAVCNIFQTVRIFESEYLDCVVNLTRS